MHSTTSSLSLLDKVRSVIALIILAMVFTISGFIAVLVGILTLGKGVTSVVNIVAPLIAKISFFIMHIKSKVIQHGQEWKKPAIYIFNHSSTLDIPITLMAKIKDARYVAKKELMYNPVFGILGLATGQVFVDRGTTKKAIKSLNKSLDKIKKNAHSLIIAPEGSRKHIGWIGPFKKGAFHMAIDLGYPIVPLYYENSRNLSEGGSLFFKSGEITIHRHATIDTINWTKETLNEHVEYVRNLYIKWAEKYDGVRNNLGTDDIEEIISS